MKPIANMMAILALLWGIFALYSMPFMDSPQTYAGRATIDRLRGPDAPPEESETVQVSHRDFRMMIDYGLRRDHGYQKMRTGLFVAAILLIGCAITLMTTGRNRSGQPSG